MFLVCEVEDVRTNSAACLSAAALCAALRCQARTLRNFTFYWTEKKKKKNKAGLLPHLILGT